jgi:hypothetical protein
MQERSCERGVAENGSAIVIRDCASVRRRRSDAAKTEALMVGVRGRGHGFSESDASKLRE